jgi:hypothetical protein
MPPTPAPPKPAPAAAPTPSALRLNLHKSDKAAPANVPTLPLPAAPAFAAPRGGLPDSAPGGEPPLGGSRLSGLNPYPNGTFPSGGSGLRGSLVGCANSEAVRLSAVEREKCASRFGSEVGLAPALDPIPAAKRAAFDRAAARDEADRRYREGSPVGTVGRGLGPDQPRSVRSMAGPPQ